MGKWGRKQVQCGTSQEWNRAVQHWDMPKVLKGTNLWMDSVDLQMKGKSVMKKKNRKWSYKLDAPGRRYLFIFDGKGRVKKWWGGYSPKIYDGHVLEWKKRWMRKRLKDAVVIADQHFAWGKRHFKGKVKFHTPIKKPKRVKKGSVQKQLSKGEKDYNKSVHQVRARVERWFAQMKGTVESLGKIWWGREDALDNVVSFAVGVQNGGRI